MRRDDTIGAVRCGKCNSAVSFFASDLDLIMGHYSFRCPYCKSALWATREMIRSSRKVWPHRLLPIAKEVSEDDC